MTTGTIVLTLVTSIEVVLAGNSSIIVIVLSSVVVVLSIDKFVLVDVTVDNGITTGNVINEVVMIFVVFKVVEKSVKVTKDPDSVSGTMLVVVVVVLG